MSEVRGFEQQVGLELDTVRV